MWRNLPGHVPACSDIVTHSADDRARDAHRAEIPARIIRTGAAGTNRAAHPRRAMAATHLPAPVRRLRHRDRP
jgi:hypothetical protein